jgi:hypothetical protein
MKPSGNEVLLYMGFMVNKWILAILAKKQNK